MTLAKNTVTGITTNVPAHYIGHPVLGKNLVAVGGEVKTASKKENKKEQPAPKAEPALVEAIIEDNKEQNNVN